MASKGFLIGTVFNAPPPTNIVECTTYESSITDELQSAEASLGIGEVWTWAFWQRRTVGGQASDRRAIFSTQANTVNGRINWTQRNDNDCLIEIRADGGSSGTTKTYTFDNMPTAAADAPWEHIALVYNSNGGGSDTLRTYYNGVDITDKTATDGIGDVRIIKTANNNPGQTDIPRTITIGASRNGGSDWQGRIYNFGIWDVELDTANVFELYNNGVGSEVDLLEDGGGYNSSADLQHYYRFADANDRGLDLGHNVTKHNLLDGDSGAHTFLTNDCPDTYVASGQSLEFDESAGAHLETTTDETTFDFGFPNGSGEFSISVWARLLTPQSVFNNQQPYGLGNGGGAQNRFWFTHNGAGNGMSFALYAGIFAEKNYAVSLAMPTVGEWYMFTVTFDGQNNADSLKLYLNSTYDSTPTKNTDQDASGLTAINMRGSIGANGNNGGGFNADHRIYSLATWDSVLSAAEVTAIYNGKDPSNMDLLVSSGDYASASALKSWWLPGSEVSPDLGKDYGPQSIDMTRETAITDNDIIFGDIPKP